MKMAVVNMTPMPKGFSIIRSNHISAYLSKLLNVPILDSAEALKTKVELLIVVNGMLKFCPYREELRRAMQKAERVVYCTNEYSARLPASFATCSKRPMALWTNIPSYCKLDEDSYVNWNLMTWYPPARKNGGHKYEGILYHGSFRKGRIEYFRKYFAGAKYPVHLSTTKKALPLFMGIDKGMRFVETLKGNKSFGLFQATVYIEDKYTHKHYNSLANRFYECFSNGVAILIDETCSATFEKAGMKGYERYIVRSQADVSEALKRTAEIEKEQQRLWWTDYPELLKKQIREAVKKL